MNVESGPRMIDVEAVRHADPTRTFSLFLAVLPWRLGASAFNSRPPSARDPAHEYAYFTGSILIVCLTGCTADFASRSAADRCR